MNVVYKMQTVLVNMHMWITVFVGAILFMCYVNCMPDGLRL